MRPHYLTDLGNDLEAALALAVHDLVATQMMSADAALAAVAYRADLRRRALQGPESDFEEGAGATVVCAVEDLQQDILEGITSLGPRSPSAVVWPRCPAHPSHPLWLRSEGESDPAWTCPTTQKVVAELGDL